MGKTETVGRPNRVTTPAMGRAAVLNRCESRQWCGESAQNRRRLTVNLHTPVSILPHFFPIFHQIAATLPKGASFSPVCCPVYVQIRHTPCGESSLFTSDRPDSINGVPLRPHPR